MNKRLYCLLLIFIVGISLYAVNYNTNIPSENSLYKICLSTHGDDVSRQYLENYLGYDEQHTYNVCFYVCGFPINSDDTEAINILKATVSLIEKTRNVMFISNVSNGHDYLNLLYVYQLADYYGGSETGSRKVRNPQEAIRLYEELKSMAGKSSLFKKGGRFWILGGTLDDIDSLIYEVKLKANKYNS